MIELLSLLVGLVTNVRTLEFQVTGPVAQVEVHLDGEALGTLTGPPWQIPCDFGPELRPHEVLAIARGTKGQEVDRVRKWVNLERRGADATMVLLPDRRGRPEAVGFRWEIVGGRRPLALEVSFDGQPLPVEDPRRIPLPPYDLDEFHYLSATLHFSGGRTRQLEAGFGGALGTELDTALTAVTVVVERGRLPRADKMEGWFQVDGEPLEVHGVERGPAELILVRDTSAQPYFDRMADQIIQWVDLGPGLPRENQENFRAEHFFPIDGKMLQDQRLSGGFKVFALGTLRKFAAPHSELAVSFVSTVPSPLFRRKVRPEMFVHSEPVSSAEGGFLWLSQQPRREAFSQQISYAVAIAGLVAHSSHRRRTVVLLLGEETGDVSPQTPAVIRRFLRDLQIPFEVWTVLPDVDEHPQWGALRYVGHPAESRKEPIRLAKAVENLEQTLRSQRIIWVKGHHLPQKIELGPAARGVRFAGWD